jgi:Zn-dependent peptidase ImmA (M78 family)
LLVQWEQTGEGITVAKLQTIADLYRRPLAAFFLSERPEVPERVRDYRRPWKTAKRPESAQLAAEIRRAEGQRENLLEILDLRDEEPSGAWKVPATINASGRTARALLDEHSLVPRPGASGKPTDWFFYWSSALEQMGVLVVTANAVKPAEADGFSIAADPVPIVAVNGATHFNRRIFTLMHEYAHLLRNTSALCDLHEGGGTSEDVDREEVECNRMASDILVPSDEFARRTIVTQSRPMQTDWPLHVLRMEARHWGVSPEVILRKLVTHERASQTFYSDWRDAQPDLARDSNGTDGRANGGGDGLRTKVRNLGKGYVRNVIGALAEGYISTYETSNMLNAKVDQIPKMLERARIPGVD